jgi:aminopeptidase N
VSRRFRCLVLCAVAAVAHDAKADTYPRQPGIDAVHYVFRLRISDTSDEITGEASLTLRTLRANVSEVALDLASARDGKGMRVSAVAAAGRAVAHSHDADRLRIPLPPAPAGTEIAVTVTYAGIPAGGLRLIDNMHGERTAFSENWPSNARQWLPMIDHPYDKATGEFIVTAPARYQVVSNGVLVEEVDIPGGERRTHWRQSVPIASWLYALGVARFAVHHYEVVRGIPQQVWAFPQDRDRAYELFETTGRRAFEFFSDWIGEYAYEKLGHVQAAGLGGGTEHATAIFYGEKGVAAGRAPVVHEVAHQWWGNAVTERDWDDVWLSEGFATYFTHLYTEHVHGRDAFVRGLVRDIDVIARAQAAAPAQPIIHRNIEAADGVPGLLNRLVYQKGAWVLHMLRGLVGSDVFRSALREYYRRYRNANASTDDFRQVVEQASGRELGWFFDQWLRRPGVPAVSGSWRYVPDRKEIELELRQMHAGDPFRLPIEIGLTPNDGAPIRVERIELTEAAGRFTIPAGAEPASVVLDPNTWVLLAKKDLVRSAGL